VRDILTNPAIGERLLKGYDPTQDADVGEATRRLCYRRHVLVNGHPKVKADVIQRAVRWERTKTVILDGGPRPRELGTRSRR
jgi:hypothetical protein